MRNVILTAAALMAMAAPVSSQAPVAPSRQAVIDELVVATTFWRTKEWSTAMGM